MESKLKFVDLNKNLIDLIVSFFDKHDYTIIFPSKNKKIFKLMLRYKNSMFDYFKSDLTLINFKGKFHEYEGYGLCNTFVVYPDHQNIMMLAIPEHRTNNILIINLFNNKIVITLKGYNSKLSSLIHHKDNHFNYLISTRRDKSHTIWDLKTFDEKLKERYEKKKVLIVIGFKDN